MPTDIHFAGENVRITVIEDPGEVAEAFTSAHGDPFRLIRQASGSEVYVNPALVAFWSASEPNREPEHPPETPQTTAKRQAVTDIWGNPLRKKPRR